VKPEQTEDRFVLEVRKQAERSRRGRRQNLLAGFGIVGSVGLMVVLPALLGVAIGRYLDVRVGGGIFWTLSLLALGLALGCTVAWRNMQETMKE
jgi:ATP synthase protein I